MPRMLFVDGATVTFGDTILRGGLSPLESLFPLAPLSPVVSLFPPVDQVPATGPFPVAPLPPLVTPFPSPITPTVTVDQFLTADIFVLRAGGRGSDDVVTAGPFGVAYGDARTLIGVAQGGNDVIVLDAGFASSTGFGDAEVMANNAQGGNDTLSGSGSQHGLLQMFGDAQTMSGRTVGGDDLLNGPAVISHVDMFGDAQVLSNQAVAGDDTISGPSFNSLPGGPTADLYGDGQSLSDRVVCGNDLLTAVSDSAAVRMFGDGQTITGEVLCGDDTLSGAPASFPGAFGHVTVMFGDGESLGGASVGGADVLVSGAGDDVMWGDAAQIDSRATTGADRFLFVLGNGHDQIGDFEPGRDRIELGGFGVVTFDALAQLFQPTSEGVLISFGADNDILLRGVVASQLTADDFLLA